MDGIRLKQTGISGFGCSRSVRQRPFCACFGLFLLVLFSFFSGCSSKIVELTRATTHPELRPQGVNSFGQLTLTPETTASLNQLGLGKGNWSNLEKLAKLQEEANEGQNPDFLLAFCELGYYEASRLEKSDSAFACEIYTSVLLNSYRYLFDPAFEGVRNPFDHRYRLAASYYNRSAERLLREIFQNRRDNGLVPPVPGDDCELSVNGKSWRISCELERSSWLPSEIGEIQFASDYKVDGLAVHYAQEGLGVPVIVSRKRCGRPEENLFPSSLSFPMTLFFRPNPYGSAPGTPKGRGDEPNVVLEFYDPLLQKSTNVGDVCVSLAADLTTPLSYNFIDPSVNELGLIGLMRPETFYKPIDGEKENRTLAGFYMITPPDPHKIPVVLVHGLWSTPMTWLAMVGAFQNDPEVWDRYQFWFWCYPTGIPWWVSAANLRRDLQNMYAELDPSGTNPNYRNSVIIGYSMGGLIADLQVCESGNEVWNLVSDKPFNPAEFKNPEEIHDIFFFHPNPNLTRLITIATPFKGSDFVNTFVQWFADKVIVPPDNFNRMAKFLNAAHLSNRKRTILDAKNSVESMAPGSPFFEALDQLERPESVAFNNIIGMTESGLLIKKTEGDKIVSFDSAHRGDAESEIAVDSYHSYVHTDPVAIRETIRILKEHLSSSENGFELEGFARSGSFR